MISKTIRTYCSGVSKVNFLLLHERLFHKNVTKNSSKADYRMAPNVFRQKKMYTAIVDHISTASPSIKILRLCVRERGFSFKAGQWVDFYIPGIDEVTGYSMTSAPNQAREKGILELAVKYAKFPPTDWIHNECLPGQEIQIRVGGDFYYDPLSNQRDAESNILLVGGGVGINPLVSILHEYSDLLLSKKFLPEESKHFGKVHLLYSAKNEDELVFRDTFIIMEKEHPSLTCEYFVTRQLEAENKLSSGIHNCRIKEENITSSIKILGTEKTLCYICGPSIMTDDVANWLLKLGINKENIRYEKWW